jgi:hypothetical protein
VETLIILNHDDASGDCSRLFQGLASEMNGVERDALLRLACRRPGYHDGATSSSCRPYPCVTLRDLSDERESRGIIAAGIRYRTCHDVRNRSSFAQTKPGQSPVCASFLALRMFGPVSSKALVAVLRHLRSGIVGWHPGTTTLPRRRLHAQSHSKLTSHSSYWPLTYKPKLRIRYTFHQSWAFNTVTGRRPPTSSIASGSRRR